MARRKFGFSLIEVVVSIGILGLLISGSFLIGFPEYNRFLNNAETKNQTNILLDKQAKDLVIDKST